MAWVVQHEVICLPDGSVKDKACAEQSVLEKRFNDNWAYVESHEIGNARVLYFKREEI